MIANLKQKLSSRFKIKAPRLKLNIIPIVRFVALVAFTVFGLTSLLIALPMTEEYIGSAEYNLDVKNPEQYWKAAYVIELKIKKEDRNQTTARIEYTKSVLAKRLQSYGVEEFTINNYTPDRSEDRPELGTEQGLPEVELNQGDEVSTDDTSETLTEQDVTITNDGDGSDTLPTEEIDFLATSEEDEYDSKFLRIVVQSSQDQQEVESLISTRYFIRILDPKDDIDFNSAENQLAAYLPENYNRTDFTRRDFRNIAVKELPTTGNGTSFFAIFKPWFFTSGDFNDFMSERAGQQIGIAIDDFVSPYTVPALFGQNPAATGQRPEFAPSIAQTEEQAEVADILFNSGVIPVEMELAESEVLTADKTEIDYEEVLVAFLISVLILAGFTIYRDSSSVDTSIKYALVASYTIVTWMAFLKLTATPVDLEILLLTGVTLFATLKIYYFNYSENNIIEIITLGLIGLAALSLGGYALYFAQMLFIVLASAVVFGYLVNFYVDNMKKFLSR